MTGSFSSLLHHTLHPAENHAQPQWCLREEKYLYQGTDHHCPEENKLKVFCFVFSRKLLSRKVLSSLGFLDLLFQIEIFRYCTDLNAYYAII